MKKESGGKSSHAFMQMTWSDRKNSKEQEISTDRIPLLAAWGACTITRTCSRTAFEKMGRSMQTSDMLTESKISFDPLVDGQLTKLSAVGKAYDSHFGEGAKL